ncbi:MAG: PAC2 family protein [Spirochaetaceae bacterium]|nr:PAC2 family protein [Spirochaetaceae bacterium]
MLDPRGLYEVHNPTHDPTAVTERDQPSGGPVLLHALTGFIDAGQAGALAAAHLLGTMEHRPLVTFDVDQLLDYRSRRPPMLFIEDHWESYEDPSLVLHELTDAAGVRFLLLAGAEPDVQWERFIAAVAGLVDELGVRLTIGVHGIPMGVPHTRPTSVTAHATRNELVAGRDAWVGTVQVPGSIINLLELRLGQAGQDAMGFAVHVPHYLAQADYPDAAAALLENVTAATDLTLPTATLRAAAEAARVELDEQVAGSAEVAAVVHALEQQYDTYVEARGGDAPGDDQGLLAGRRGFPTADELGAELERFLAEQPKGGGEHTDP